MTTAAYGTYPRTAALSEIVFALNRSGFEKEDICMVLSPGHPAASAMRDGGIASIERGSAQSARTIGWFSEFGAVVIPTVGLFIRSLSFFRALMGEPGSAALCGGRTTTLRGLGFSEDEARRLDRQLDDIGALIYVACPESARAESARELMRLTGARETAALAPIAAAAAV